MKNLSRLSGRRWISASPAPSPVTPGATRATTLTRRLQRGYTMGLGALSVAFGMGAVGAMGVDWADQTQQLASLTTQATAYAQVSRALGNYATLYYPQLIDISHYPDSCANVPYRAGAWTPASAGSCSAQLSVQPSTVTAGTASAPAGVVPATVTVANILQPTIAELKALQLLDATLPEAPVLPVSYGVATGPASTPGGAPQQANTYGTRVSRIPVNSGINLETLVFNVQPFDVSRSGMNQLLVYSNGMGAISGYADVDSSTSQINPGFDLVAASGIWRRTNPVRQAGTSTGGATSGAAGSGDTGMPGIVAWVNTYDATASLTLQRRDGLLPPTGDWSFNNQNLTGVSRIEIAELQALNTLTVGGELEAHAAVKALRDLTVAGMTSLHALVVSGPATFGGPVSFQDNVAVVAPAGSTQHVRVALGSTAGGTQLTDTGVSTPSLSTPGLTSSSNGTHLTPAADVGMPCSVSNALAQEEGLGRLLICKNASWQFASFDTSVVVAPAANASCYPEGSLTLFADGTPAICRGSLWVGALQPGVLGQACPIQGGLSSQTSAQGVSNLLVCQNGTWSTDIYARPMLTVVAPGAACRSDEINAIARSNAGPGTGLLMCTDDGQGHTRWQLPFAVSEQSRTDSFNVTRVIPFMVLQ